MKPKTILWIVVGLLLAVAAVSLFRPSGGTGVANVDAAGAQSAIDGGAQIIDVRTAGEFQMGHIPGAVNVPVDQLESAATSWDRDAKYLVYCATGSRSVTAVQLMQGLGFKSIAHFNAGIQAWSGNLETGAQASTQTIQTSGKPVFVEFYTDS